MKKEERIKQIIELLQQAQKIGGISIKELARELNITERTVYSDLKFIESEMAMPLQRPKVKSRNCEGKYLLKIENSDWELTPLYSLVLEKKFWPGISIIGRSGTGCPEDTKIFADLHIKFQDLSGKLKIKDHELVNFTEGKEKLKSFLQSLIENRELEITYTAFYRNHEVSRRTIRPYGLVWFNANWYTVGYCLLRKAIRTFKLDRVIKVELLNTTFSNPNNFSLDQYFAQSWGVIVNPDQSPKEVKLLFSPQVANEVIKYRYHPSQQNRWIDNGWLEVTFSITAVAEMKKWVLSWGSDVLVVEPEELRQELVQLLKACLQNLETTCPKKQ